MTGPMVPGTVRRVPGTIRPRRSAALVAVLVCGSCSLIGGGDEASDSTDDSSPLTTVPTRVIDDPFCQSMVDLRAQALEGELPDDPNYVRDTYVSLLPVVPPALEADFAQMIAEIEAGLDVTDQPDGSTLPPATTLAPVEGDDPTDTSVVEGAIESEGYLPDDTAIERVQEWVVTNCTATANNPGPAATPPP